MNKKKKPANKYRPSLTANQISHILVLAKTEVPISQESMNVISTLAPFQAKIENDGIGAAYIANPRESIISMEALGETGVNAEEKAALAGKTKEDYWHECYIHLQETPEHCSLDVIKAAKEHMYLNDLMSAKEIAEYEGGEV